MESTDYNSLTAEQKQEVYELYMDLPIFFGEAWRQYIYNDCDKEKTRKFFLERKEE